MKTKTKTLLNLVSVFLISLSVVLFSIFLMYTTDLKDRTLAEHRESLKYILSLIDERIQSINASGYDSKLEGFQDTVYNEIVGSIADYFSGNGTLLVFRTENKDVIYPPSRRGSAVPEEVLSATGSRVEGEVILPDQFGYFVTYGRLNLTFFLSSRTSDVFLYRNILLLTIICITLGTALIVVLIHARIYKTWKLFLDAAVRRFRAIVLKKDKIPEGLTGGYGVDEQEFTESFNALTEKITEWMRKRDTGLKTLTKQRDNLKKIVLLYKKYIPDKTLLRLNEETVTETVSRKQNVTSLMVELQDFLSPIEELYPQVVTDELNDFHIFLKTLVTKNNGIINFTNGYQINLAFGMPHEDSHSYIKAVSCAKEIVHWITARNQSGMKSGVKWTVRMGLSEGIGVTGVVGNEYVYIGDAVESSLIMLACARDFGVGLVTDSVQRLQDADSFSFRMLEAKSTTGIGRTIYEIFLYDHELMEQAIKLYTHGIEMFYEGNYEVAVSEFKKVIRIFQGDTPSEIFLERCEDHIKA